MVPIIIGFAMDMTYIMAQRLKQLREEREISHDRLSKTLSEQFGVKISSDSLINYEVADPNHSKAGKNNGMRVEYLRILAEFYEVSSDYLLGLSDIRSPNLSTISATQATGLSEENMSALVLSNIIKQSYISSSEPGCRPLQSYNPPFKIESQYSEFVKKYKILDYFLPTDNETASREYMAHSKDYDELVLNLVSRLPDVIDDFINAVLNDWSIINNHTGINESLINHNHKPIPPEGVLKNAFLEGKKYGFTLVFGKEYVEFEIDKIASSISSYLLKKYVK